MSRAPGIGPNCSQVQQCTHSYLETRCRPTCCGTWCVSKRKDRCQEEEVMALTVAPRHTAPQSAGRAGTGSLSEPVRVVTRSLRSGRSRWVTEPRCLFLTDKLLDYCWLRHVLTELAVSLSLRLGCIFRPKDHNGSGLDYLFRACARGFQLTKSAIVPAHNLTEPPKSSPNHCHDAVPSWSFWWLIYPCPSYVKSHWQ